MPASNFGFLGAERYFRKDPATAIFKLRQFAELLCQRIAASHALYQGDRDTFEETLRRLSFERIIPREIADVFHAQRKGDNIAGHEGKGSHSEALSAPSSRASSVSGFIAPTAESPAFAASASNRQETATRQKTAST
jgi:hypothetical protein